MERNTQQMFELARHFIPGGVNSPVRSFKGVGGSPLFTRKGKGPHIFSEEGNTFIDFCLSWGALILGHAHPIIVKDLQDAVKQGTGFGTATRAETELARLIVDAVPSIDQVRLTTSGTEAVMSAIRLARAYTNKNKVLKFSGAYHGHADHLLTKCGSGAATLDIPDSAGVPEDFSRHTLTIPFRDAEILHHTIEKHHQDLAAVILEPIQGNHGLNVPERKYLATLRELCDTYKIILIFDEVITGFRISYGGAQQYFHISPDLTCLGKIIGGGLPVGGYGGKREIMKLLAPEGAVYQAGTLAGNPLAVTAGISTLKWLKEHHPYPILSKNTGYLERECNQLLQKYHYPLEVHSHSSMWGFKNKRNKEGARGVFLLSFNQLFHALLSQGVYISPSAWEVNFLSTSHTQKEVSQTLDKLEKALKKIKEE